MDYITPPWDHQRRAVEMSFKCRDLALLWDMGVGKSKACIDILRGRFAANGRVMKTLILAPPVVLRNWKNEFAMHSRIKPSDIVIPRGTGPKRVNDLKKALYDEAMFSYVNLKIVLLNYEALQNKEILSILESWQPEVLVCDESQRCKNYKGVRAKNVAHLADFARHRYILTGTPILNSIQDIFMQYRILDCGETFGKNFFAFRSKYFEDKNAAFAHKQSYFPRYVPRPYTFDELQQKIYAKGLRALKSECLDLPEFVRTTRDVEMSPDQKRHYDEMKKEFITFIQSKEKDVEPRAVIAQLAVTKALRLQQIVSGFAKDDKGDIHELENPRLQALSELLEELTPHHKVIVWAIFVNNYASIKKVCENLKVEYAELHGEISTREKEENLKRFTKDDTCRVMIANQAAGGVGVNMVEASYSIYFSRGFALEHDLQSEARNYRGGSEIHEKITRIDLVCPGSIDELVLESLRMKKNISDRILDLGKEL